VPIGHRHPNIDARDGRDRPSCQPVNSTDPRVCLAEMTEKNLGANEQGESERDTCVAA
jgi:hypothetical protein